MSHHIHFACQIDPFWEIIKRIRERVEAALSGYAEELRHASKMTASELIENAVKYGTSVERHLGITFDFEATASKITIRVSNRVLSRADAENVCWHLEQIRAAENPETLYLQRLQTLLDHPNIERTQLGLFRIACECKFQLSCRLEQDVLTVSAVRTGAGNDISGEHA